MFVVLRYSRQLSEMFTRVRWCHVCWVTVQNVLKNLHLNSIWNIFVDPTLLVVGLSSISGKVQRMAAS